MVTIQFIWTNIYNYIFFLFFKGRVKTPFFISKIKKRTAKLQKEVPKKTHLKC